jgi:hypothetical protein
VTAAARAETPAAARAANPAAAAGLVIADRAGEPPATTRAEAALAPDPARYVHRQLDQIAPVRLQDELYRRAVWLDGVRPDHSCISVPGARGFFLDPDLRAGPAEAFLRGGEFAHLHPAQDGSLHAALPPELYRRVGEAGWGEPHPLVATMLVFGPRTPAELEAVWQILLASYRFAVGGPP